jgi:DNA-binding transcriptional LysR family regulator
MMLDMDAVRLFVLAVDFGGLTRAAEVAGTVQPVVSNKIRSLETKLGRKLLERSPRFLRLTQDGAIFLDRARALLLAHDMAAQVSVPPNVKFTIGISDHALGMELEPVLQRIMSVLPLGAMLEVRSDLSRPLRAAFEAGQFDAVIVRREAGGTEGEILGKDKLGWRGINGFELPRGIPVPLATLGLACGVRGAAVKVLQDTGRSWREAFIGGSCSVLLSAVRAGIGIAPMGDAGCGGTPDVGPSLGLPKLPTSEIVLFGRSGSPLRSEIMRALSAGVRATLN